MDALDLATRFHFHDGKMTVQRTQDCVPIAEYAKARSNEGHHGSADMKFAASIPFVMVEKYCNDNHVEFSDFMNSQEHKQRLLNDPALSHFRIWKGRV
jgi:hypothetical protein